MQSLRTDGSLKHLCNLEIEIDTDEHEDLNLVFANHGEEDETYPLTTIEIAEAQRKEQELMVYFTQNAITPNEDIHFQLIGDTQVLCKIDKLVIPASLQHRAVSRYHHYLQHPGHSRLKVAMRAMMY